MPPPPCRQLHDRPGCQADRLHPLPPLLPQPRPLMGGWRSERLLLLLLLLRCPNTAAASRSSNRRSAAATWPPGGWQLHDRIGWQQHPMPSSLLAAANKKAARSSPRQLPPAGSWPHVRHHPACLLDPLLLPACCPPPFSIRRHPGNCQAGSCSADSHNKPTNTWSRTDEAPPPATSSLPQALPAHSGNEPTTHPP